MKDVVYSPRAAREYEDIVRTAWDRWPGQAPSIIGRYLSAIDRLRKFPFSSPEVDPPFVNYPGMRFEVLDRVGHRVLYFQVTGNEIQIIRILHSAMDTRAIFGDAE